MKRFFYFLFFPLLLFGKESRELYSEALKAMSHGRYMDAKVVLQELLTTDLRKCPDIAFEAECQMAKADVETACFTAAKTRIVGLLEQTRVPVHVFRLKMLLIKAHLGEGNLEKGWLVAEGLKAEYPIKEWPMEARVLYITLEELLLEKRHDTLVPSKR